MWALLWSEVRVDDRVCGVDDDDSGGNVTRMLSTPLYVEKFVLWGVAIGVDVLLHHATVLPLRLLTVLAIALFARRPSLRAAAASTAAFDAARLCAVALAAYGLSRIHISWLYHSIRGQSFIKLYVIYNMLDIFDKMVTAVGGDVTHALQCAIRAKEFRNGLLFTFCLFIYLPIHAVLKFTQFVTLNVALNSNASSALFTLLLSNNFAEVKTSVFKRFRPENLFQIACSDAVERVALLVFLLLSGAQNARWDSAWETLGISLVVWTSEVIIDGMKHAFIVKFNSTNPKAYKAFEATLSTRILFATRKSGAALDSSHAVAQCMGMPDLVLLAVIARVTQPSVGRLWASMDASVFVPRAIGIFALLLLFRSWLGARIINRAGRIATTFSPGPTTPRALPLDEAGNLDHVKRYSLLGSKIPL